MSACKHSDFAVEAEVQPCMDAGDTIVAYACDLRIRCVECGEPFGWRGMPCGVSVNGAPMRSADALEMRAWLLSPSEIALTSGPAGLRAP